MKAKLFSSLSKNWIKRGIALTVCVLMCVSLFACTKQNEDSEAAKQSEMEKELKSNLWVYESPILVGSTKIYEFYNDGTFDTQFYAGGISTEIVEGSGTYTIENGSITIKEAEISYTIDYTFEDGILELTRDGARFTRRAK